jgi:hypothetical protein
MGFYPHTYVGCYIQFDHKEFEEEQEIVSYETDNGEVFKEEINFSPMTGDPVHKKTKTIPATKKIDSINDVAKLEGHSVDYYLEDWSQVPEYASPKGKTVLIPNQRREFGFSLEQNEIRSIDFYIEVAREEFTKSNRIFLDILKKYVDNVYVEIGVVNYES